MKFIFLLTFYAAVQPALGKERYGVHEHGIGHLDIAIEGNRANLQFNIDMLTATGIEHAAHEPGEKKIYAELVDQIRRDIASIVQFSKSLSCTFVEKKLLTTSLSQKSTEKHQDSHSSLGMEYSVECKKALQRNIIKLHFLRVFPKIIKIKVNVVTEEKSLSIDLPGNGEIAVP